MALKAMRELPDYVMAPGSPDVEGWQVHDREGHVAGSVLDLFVDTHQDEVRYLGVLLGNGRHVLVPMGELDLDEDRGVVRQLTLSRAELENLPEYVVPALSPELEERYFRLYRRGEPVGAADMSPLDYRLPPFRARGARTERLVRAPQRVTGKPRPENPSEPAEEPRTGRLMAKRQPEASAPRRKSRAGEPLPGLPGKGAGLFASSEPWDLSERTDEPAGAREHGGPEAEALWQAEQPGTSAAFGAKGKRSEENP